MNVICTAPRSYSAVATIVPSIRTSSRGIQLVPDTVDSASAVSSSCVPAAASEVVTVSTEITMGSATIRASSHWIERRPRA